MKKSLFTNNNLCNIYNSLYENQKIIKNDSKRYLIKTNHAKLTKK